MKVLARRLICWAMAVACAAGGAQRAAGQTSPGKDKSENAAPVNVLEKKFFDAIRSGNTQDVLSYVSKDGVNVGREQRTSRQEVAQEFAGRRGLYCRLFDSACIQAPIDLAHSGPTCSYRELLTKSKEVRTAGSAMTRSGVRQAILVARVKNDECPNQNLIDFVFNLQADGWKLFSIP